ncbi:probable mitochondrial import inner membrane translocase subunit TIM21 [Lolium rigidum]|uniref:probable mitochondrial import inner membrane translocase subunit TIM21 n=1 Tax=Lolium rigidum TaxID=89674 RepID=UPI001F5D578F|nr:probable mitochondrial import inner membrane translocase subunit TIM21 [Lolium rigidum]
MSVFLPRKLPTPPPKAESLPNLFIPGLSKQTTIGGLREAFRMSGEVGHVSSSKSSRWYMINSNRSGSLTVRKEGRKVLPSSIRPSASYSTQASENRPKQVRTDLTTYNIPEKPVTFAEGASYSVVILAGLGVAALAGYAVCKELTFEPKEYTIFGKALARVQSDSQVTAKIGYPITGYGTESRNRAARQRIYNTVWTYEHGVEHVEVA